MEEQGGDKEAEEIQRKLQRLYIAYIDLAVYNAAGKSDINDIGQDALPQCTHRWTSLQKFAEKFTHRLNLRAQQRVNCWFDEMN